MPLRSTTYIACEHRHCSAALVGCSSGAPPLHYSHQSLVKEFLTQGEGRTRLATWSRASTAGTHLAQMCYSLLSLIGCAHNAQFPVFMAAISILKLFPFGRESYFIWKVDSRVDAISGMACALNMITSMAISARTCADRYVRRRDRTRTTARRAQGLFGPY